LIGLELIYLRRYFVHIRQQLQDLLVIPLDLATLNQYHLVGPEHKTQYVL
jgi:hypothetical protein